MGSWYNGFNQSFLEFFTTWKQSLLIYHFSGLLNPEIGIQWESELKKIYTSEKGAIGLEENWKEKHAHTDMLSITF